MLGTYASSVGLLGAATLVGQAVLMAGGWSRWSWLAPAIGLAALVAIAWWTVRMPGEATAAAVAVALAIVLSGFLLRGRPAGRRTGVAEVAALVVVALLLGSLAFLVEGRFGILGTGLNPDMSQHLFAVDRLSSGGSERLIADGYPLGPHSLVAAVAELGPSTVEAFGGLTLAIAAAACLAPFELLGGLSRWRRFAGALCVGFAYLVSAYLVQGAFKETMQALFVLTFAICLARLVTRPADEPAGAGIGRAVPLAVLAAGSVYVYSFPGLGWLFGGAGLWAAIELLRAGRHGGLASARALVRRAAPAALVGGAVFVAAVLPELGRIAEFASFETFDPDGAGLGNLFDRLSPLQALGIWPSGDFRVEPGDGAVPALAFYIGSAAGVAALGFGVVWSWRRGERAIAAALAAAGLLWAYALVGGTPYQEAKALVLAAPLVALVSGRTLFAAAPAPVLLVFLLAAGGSSVLALANGQVGPSGYSAELAELRERLGPGSVIVYAPDELLEDQHGRDYLAWELRGNRICIESDQMLQAARQGAATLSVAIAEDGAIVPELLYEVRGPGKGPCPFIPDGARADPSAAAQRG